MREAGREQAYEEVRAALRAGRQAYVICPLVEEGEAARGPRRHQEAERLRRGPFAAFSVGLAHGAQRPDEKRAAMAAFADGRTDLLVATTVVEVGIDVANATVIVIEGAERFGLAQLHQLRGRVGRGEHPGCASSSASRPPRRAQRRLEALTQTDDGFRLAELDLEIRGEGASSAGASRARPTCASPASRGIAGSSRRRARWRGGRSRSTRAWSGPSTPCCARAVLERFADAAEAAGRVRVVAGSWRARTAAAASSAPRGPRDAAHQRPRPRGALRHRRAGRGARRARRLRGVGRPGASRRSRAGPRARRSWSGRRAPSPRSAPTWRSLGLADGVRVVAARLAGRAGRRARGRAPLRLVPAGPAL